MHLVYVDDSGDSRNGTALTALLIPDYAWNTVLAQWLEGRRQIHHEFGAPKTRELHANELYKGRGKYCETPGQSAQFSTSKLVAIEGEPEHCTSRARYLTNGAVEAQTSGSRPHRGQIAPVRSSGSSRGVTQSS